MFDGVADALLNGVVDDAVDAVADLGVLAVADCVEEQPSELGAAQGFSKHVEDLALVGDSLLFDLVEQTEVHLRLAGLGGDEIPHMADLGLADSMDSTEALLNAIRVPGKVVVDDQVGSLEVDAFARSIGGDEHEARLVLGEAGLDLAPILAWGTAGDELDGLGITEEGAQSVYEVVHGVAMFGEDEELST